RGRRRRGARGGRGRRDGRGVPPGGARGTLMAVVGPLAGVRYDPARVGDVGRVLAPPYDVITPAGQEELYARSPWNVIRLILPRDADRGAAAGRTPRQGIAAGGLRPAPEP